MQGPPGGLRVCLRLARLRDREGVRRLCAAGLGPLLADALLGRSLALLQGRAA